MFKKILLGGIILLIAALAGTYFVRNMLVKKAVETGSTYALGVKTDLGSAALEISGGTLELNNLVVRNPEGFTADNFLSLRRGLMAVKTGSLLDDEVVVDSFIIDGITLDLEQIDKKGNYQVLLDHIDKLDMSSSGESHKFRIGLIALRDVNVVASLSLLGKKAEKSFRLDNFSLRDVGGDNGASIGQITATVVKALASRAVTAGKGLLPDGFGQNLSDLKNQTVEKLKTNVTDKLKDATKSLTGDGQ